MAVKLTPLPYSKDALAPFLSSETVEFHYHKHHKGYVEKLNSLIKGTALDKLELTEIIKQSSGAIFNNAAQVWNHDFYWRSMTPQHKELSGEILFEAVERSFGSLEKCKTDFVKKSVEHFGSGYTWLLCGPEGKLTFETWTNAECPVKKEKIALFNCDLWEHSYYIDYRNERQKYLERFWPWIDWRFAEQNYSNFTQSSKFSRAS